MRASTQCLDFEFIIRLLDEEFCSIRENHQDLEQGLSGLPLFRCTLCAVELEGSELNGLAGRPFVACLIHGERLLSSLLRFRGEGLFGLTRILDNAADGLQVLAVFAQFRAQISKESLDGLEGVLGFFDILFRDDA